MPLLLAIGHEFVLGSYMGPPLAFWLGEIAYRLGGAFGLYALAQACIVLTYWAVFALGRDIVVPTGLAIPPGWDARLEAHVDYERSTAGEYEIENLGHFSPTYPFQVATPSVCATHAAMPLPLAIHTGPGTHHIVVVLRPSLTAAGC